MVISTSCCFNISPSVPPTTSSSSIPPSGTQQLVSSRPKEFSLRNQCVVGMACAIISLQAEGLIGNENDNAIAATPTAVVKSMGKYKRWSDKRICPQWQQNSLETIVPENLPRPSFKRRWESVGDHYSKVAPPVKASTTTTTTTGNCFSM